MPRREIAADELLRNTALFRQLDAASRARIAAGATKRRLQRGDAAFRRGQLPAGFFIIVYGEIALFGPGARGPRLVGLVEAGRSFGEPIMFLGKPYIVDAIAQSDALLLFVPKDAVFAEIERSPAFARRMLAGLAARIESLVHEIDSHARGSARERLIDYLVRASKVSAGEAVVQLPVTKAALASQLGLTAEHLSRLLRDLTDRGLARIEGRRIAIADLRALAAHRRRPVARGRASGSADP